jgi:hypothetical protein
MHRTADTRRISIVEFLNNAKLLHLRQNGYGNKISLWLNNIISQSGIYEFGYRFQELARVHVYNDDIYDTLLVGYLLIYL